MRTVFHVSTDDRDDQAAALSSVSNLLADDSVELDDVAVVVNGDAVRMLAQGSPHDSRVVGLVDDVSFGACSNSLRSRELSADDLFDGVETVSSGVGELTRLQNEGYAYVRP